MEMPKTVEELQDFVDQRIDNHKTERSTPAVREFKKDLERWLDTIPRKDRNGSRSAIYTLIKTKIGLTNIQNLAEDQVPEARKLFESYKQLLAV